MNHAKEERDVPNYSAKNCRRLPLSNNLCPSGTLWNNCHLMSTIKQQGRSERRQRIEALIGAWVVSARLPPPTTRTQTKQ